MKIKVTGAVELSRKLLNTIVVKGELGEATAKAGLVINQRLKTYPRQRPSTKYKRTGTLGRKWAVKSYASGVEFFAVNSNPTEYMPYVQSPDDQAWMHKGRWPTSDKILAEQRQKILGFYQYAVNNINKMLGR